MRRIVAASFSRAASGRSASIAGPLAPAGSRAPATLKRKAGVKPRNILFLLTDDHRYDAMSFMKAQSFGETPTLDRLAREGVQALAG